VESKEERFCLLQVEVALGVEAAHCALHVDDDLLA